MKFGLIAFLACLIYFSAWADVSFVAEISTRAEAQDSVKAKDEAMLKAHREAFLEVAGRLTAKENVEQLNLLSDDQLMHFIREVAVVSEKTSAVSYQADLYITINGSLLKQYMQENNMLEAAITAHKALIIPIYAEDESGSKKLWEASNVWRNAWLDKGEIISGTVKLSVISDIVPNHQNTKIDKLSNADAQMYQELVKINKNQYIYVVEAENNGSDMLTISVQALKDGSRKRFIVFDAENDVREKAISEVVAYITAEMNKRDIYETGSGSLEVICEYGRLKNWLEMERKLKGVPQIKAIQTGAAVNGKVQIKLDYIGTYQTLTQALDNLGYSLLLDNGIYILKQEKF